MKLRLGVLFILFMSFSAQGGIYSTLEPPVFDFKEDGLPVALPSSGYHSHLATVLDIGIDTPDRPNKPREMYLKLLDPLQKRDIEELEADELVQMSAALLRLKKLDDAINLLRPLERDRRANFFLRTHLAVACQYMGEWMQAGEAQGIAKSEFPTAIPRFEPPQVAWYRKVEREFYLRFLQLRAAEQRRGTRNVDEVDAIFGDVKFIGEDGQYQPGQIAADQKAKLPPDALAIAQQLSLWAPEDTRLYWLVGELFNAKGDVPAAVRIFDTCVDSRRYQNPTLSEHRRILKDYISEQQRLRTEEDSAAWRPDPIRVWLVGVALGLFIAFLAYWQTRQWLSKR